MTTNIMKPEQLKKAALNVLKRSWAEALFISMLNAGIFLAIYLLVILIGRLTGVHTADTLLPVFSSFNMRFFLLMLFTVIFFYLAAAPIYYGTKWFFWQAAGGNVMPVSAIFAGYSSFGQFRLCVRLRVMTDIRKAPPFLFFGLAAAVEGFLARRMIHGMGGTEVKIFANLGCAVMAAGIVYICFCMSMKYVPVGFLLADNPDSSVSGIFTRSISLVNRRYGYMLRLYISFLPWFLFCLLIFPVIALVPYLDITLAVFIRECMKNPEPPKKPVRQPAAAGAAKAPKG